VVNWLDRFLPRPVAALLTMLTVVAILVLFVVQLVPTLGLQLGRLLAMMPSAAQLRESIDRLNLLITALPPAMQNAIQFSLEQTLVSLRAYIENFFANLPLLATGVFLSLVRFIGALLGLIVLPTWLLIVLTDQKKGVQAVNRLIPRANRADFWAMARIVDRSFRAFFQTQVTQGILVALSLYGAIWVLETMGLIEVQFPLVYAIFGGLMELIPEVGPLVVVVVFALSGLIISPATALLAVTVYVFLHWLLSLYARGRAVRKVRRVHPAILIVAAVALSQIGLFWVFLTLPLLTAGRDLVRYANGRLSEPPRPAGLLPDEREDPARARATRNPLGRRRIRPLAQEYLADPEPESWFWPPDQQQEL
jgi:predicted PurR-regulated permease PerM